METGRQRSTSERRLGNRADNLTHHSKLTTGRFDRHPVAVDPILKKLNYKAQSRVAVLDAPAGFEATLRLWSKDVPVASTSRADDAFVLAFVSNEDRLRAALPTFARLAEPGVAVMWVAYPKGTSKTMRSDINRDSIHRIVQEYGFELNRNVALDDDWSALRFKPIA